MEENETYKRLAELLRQKDQWEDSIAYVAGLIPDSALRIKAKALWVFGEMGLHYPKAAAPYVSNVGKLLNVDDDLIRERAVTALGRIGRAEFTLVCPYFESMFELADDRNPKVRLALIWASENIAVNTPSIYKEYMGVFAKLLEDGNDRVRIEAPEIFRVLGKHCKEFVWPYLDKLRELSENDPECVVRIHAKGAIKAALR